MAIKTVTGSAATLEGAQEKFDTAVNAQVGTYGVFVGEPGVVVTDKPGGAIEYTMFVVLTNGTDTTDINS